MSYPPGPFPPPNPPGEPTPGYGALVVPTPEERNWALGAHVGSLVAAWFAFGFVAPLIVLLVKGKNSAFVRRHAVESLNFQISLLIYLAVGFVLVFVGIGLVLIPAIGIAALVLIIVATVKASNGEEFRYPLTLRLVS